MADWVEIPNKPGLWRTGGINFAKLPLPILARSRIPISYWITIFAGASFGAYYSPLLFGLLSLAALALSISQFRAYRAKGSHLRIDKVGYVDKRQATAINFAWGDVEAAGWVSENGDSEPDFVVRLKHPIASRSPAATLTRRLGLHLLKNEYRLDFTLLDVDEHAIEHAIRQLIVRNGGTVVDRLR